jgi:replicative DNA helicase
MNAPLFNEAPLPPHNIPLEQALLGAVLLNNEALRRVAYVRPEHFYDAAHARIFGACRTLVDRGDLASPVTLRHHFESDAGLSDVGGAEYLSRLYASAITARDADSYGKGVVDLWRRRAAIAAANALLDLAWDQSVETESSHMLGEHIAALQGLASEGGAAKWSSMPDVAGNAVQAACDAANGKGIPAVTTGITDLDAALAGGFRAGELIVVAGRPGMGKTSFGVHLALEAAAKGHLVGFYSLEMPEEQVARRALAMTARVPFQAIRKGELWVIDKLPAGLRAVQSLPVLIDDTPALTLADIQARSTLKPFGMLIVDHIGLMRPSADLRRAGRVHQIEEITNGLKALAKRLAAPVIALCQLSRESTKRDDKRPTLADLRDSGAIEQDADTVLMLHRDNYYLKLDKTMERGLWAERLADSENIAEIRVAKNREGDTSDIEVFCDIAQNRWGNLSR